MQQRPWSAAVGSELRRRQRLRPPILTLTPEYQVRFASSTNVSYQLLASEDLVQWKPLNDPIAGSGAELALGVDPKETPRRFFRIQASTVAPTNAAAGLTQGIRARQTALDVSGPWLATALEAVALASSLGADGERLVLSGTLQQKGGSWTYSSDPREQLLITLTNGVASLQFSALDGDFGQDSISAFFAHAHQVEVQVAQPSAGIDLRLSSSLSGISERLVVKGVLRDDHGISYTVDVEKLGTRNVSVESNAASYEAERVIRGSISAADFHMTLDSAEWYKSLIVENFVENWTRIWNDTWEIAGQRYDLNGSDVKLALKNNRVIDFDSYWVAEGDILLNGAPYARLSLGQDSLGFITVQLTTPGATEVLERYQP